MSGTSDNPVSEDLETMARRVYANAMPPGERAIFFYGGATFQALLFCLSRME